MNFTREPIIETVITPREGMKLLIRSSKASHQEDYFVDAVEVVSFGQALFFRSLERPKSFLVPMSDYEVIEMKEIKVPLKATSPEKSIKIGGGKELRAPSREIAVEEKEALPVEAHSPSEARPQQHHHEVRQQDRKRDGKRRRGRRGPRHESSPVETNHGGHSLGTEEEKSLSLESVEEQKTPSFISKLFPPPPTLIKETLSRYKPVEPPVVKEEDLIVEEKLEEELFEIPESMEPSDEEN